MKPLLSHFPKKMVIQALLFALATFFVRLKYIALAFHEGLIYFVGADCYTRMYRVQELLSQNPLQQLAISFHSFENFPHGIESHATAPLDWLICLLSSVFGILQLPQNIDLAGMLIGPLLAALAGFFLAIGSEKISLGWARWLLLGTYLLSPPLIWATTIGRPDHQCLLISLLTIAMVAELLRWDNSFYHPVAGLTWGSQLMGIPLGTPCSLCPNFFLQSHPKKKGESFLYRWGYHRADMQIFN